jgi:hypothetical protein
LQLSRNFEVIDHGRRLRIADAKDAVLESLEMDSAVLLVAGGKAPTDPE